MLSACSFSIVVYCDLGTLCDTAPGVHPLLMAAMTRQEYVYVYVHVYVYVVDPLQSAQVGINK